MHKPSVVLTGVSRGIGAQTAKYLTEQGYHVIGLARTEPLDFDGTFRAVDLADASAKQVFAEIAEEFGPTRLVANAGYVDAKPIEDVTDEGFEQTIKVNLQSQIWAMQAMIPAMRKAQFGRVVMIGSRASLGKPERATYSSSKAALTGLARTAALELAPDGITVNVISPGPFETEMFSALQPEGSEKRANFMANVPMNRVGKPEEIAATIAFFLSEGSGFVTGQNLFICGGLSLGSVF
ncbi:SDR family NAD(P)-dependent oxidoreductase [Antarcticimicrobium sediminis]|uniref:SDR family oxidoreductase n=1 Tax=Antarcticimicrobium sediminis TaxID=2546227 RepID=A0A4R5EMP3_9RHOB|nr:SDR family oxidoreductase [Antarcticimicrobium sediminis]TDE35653.1 SDR family oxidoreductase [Antarcticimicrobium sediminis]